MLSKDCGQTFQFWTTAALGCRCCGFRQARSRPPLPDGVLAVGGATAAISPPSVPTPSPSGQRYGRGRHDRRRPVRGTSACAWNIARPWNIAVRTRGVFTHRDDFQKPACAERGLVRTGIALGRPGLVSTESQSFQNPRPLPSAPCFQSPQPIPSDSPMYTRAHRHPQQRCHPALVAFRRWQARR